jgi:HD-GYP domain-containing protein (c-di-GMP phosphodiesterase class II)
MRSIAPKSPESPDAIAARLGLPSAFAMPEAPTAGDPERTIDRTLDTAREMLGMDVAYLADLRDGVQLYRRVTGDGESFGIRSGESVPLEGTYCEALTAGRLDNIVNDAGTHPVVKDLAITERSGIGAYVGMPVHLSDGSLFGTFCCLSHAPMPSLQQRDVRFMGLLAELLADQLEREGRAKHAWLMAAAAGSVEALLAGLTARDGYTGAHSHAVVDLALAIGRRLDLDEIRLTNLHWTALLHDIGKLGIPEAILRKPGRLTDAERLEMRRHAEIGERIIAATPELAHLARGIRAEHERWDGAGYPDGLKGEEIPISSRIVFVSDAYHAMTSERPYRAARTPAQARRELQRTAGSQFCPAVVEAALAILA